MKQGVEDTCQTKAQRVSQGQPKGTPPIGEMSRKQGYTPTKAGTEYTQLLILPQGREQRERSLHMRDMALGYKVDTKGRYKFEDYQEYVCAGE